MSRFQKWALATTIATYLQILVGGMVRAAGAGLGCPDWPQCYGRYYPPLSKSQLPPEVNAELFDIRLAWIEYTNRMVGVVIGLLILGTLYYAIKHHRDQPRILYPTLGAFGLVLVEGWLGGQVVASELAPWVVTAHLVMALIIVSLLLYATVGAFFPPPVSRRQLQRPRRQLAWLALGVLLLTLVQVGLGAKLRGDLELVQEAQPELARPVMIEQVGWADPVHRSFSWLVLLGTAAIVYHTHRRMAPNNWLRNTAQGLATLVLLQIGTGIGLAYGGLPPFLQVTHLVNASLLIGLLTLLYLLTNRLPQQAESGSPADRPQPHLSQSPTLR